MPGFDGFTQSGATHMGIDFGGREVGVAEHGLDRAQVGSALEQIRSERVPQYVGGNAILREPRRRCVSTQSGKEILTSHGFTAPREKHRLLTLRAGSKKNPPGFPEIGLEGSCAWSPRGTRLSFRPFPITRKS